MPPPSIRPLVIKRVGRCLSGEHGRLAARRRAGGVTRRGRPRVAATRRSGTTCCGFGKPMHIDAGTRLCTGTTTPTTARTLRGRVISAELVSTTMCATCSRATHNSPGVMRGMGMGAPARCVGGRWARGSRSAPASSAAPEAAPGQAVGRDLRRGHGPSSLPRCLGRCCAYVHAAARTIPVLLELSTKPRAPGVGVARLGAAVLRFMNGLVGGSAGSGCSLARVS